MPSSNTASRRPAGGAVRRAALRGVKSRLLVPVDGSKSALRALGYAIRLAKQRGGTAIHLLHVQEEALVYGEIAVYVTLARMQVLHRAEPMLRRSGLPYTKELRTGPVARTIARRATSLHCESIVMGTQGLGAVGSLLLGSIANGVVHYSRVPVTLVK